MKITCTGAHGETKDFAPEELSFRPSAYAVIIKEGKVLLLPQWDGYDFPGGGVDIHERIQEGVIREVKEETGLDVKISDFLFASDSFYYRPDTNKGLHSLLFYYLCEVIGGTITDEGFNEYERSMAKKAEWIDLGQVPNIKFINSIDSLALIKLARDKHGS
jgi:8-oxo-dGTP diphosphatase